VASTTTRLAAFGRQAVVMAVALLPLGCARPHVSPLAPPPYRAEIGAGYDATWTALVRALAKQNLPLRAIARDSGVIATDDVVTPIGVYSDCGRNGDDQLEGEALVTFTVFAEPTGDSTRLQINSSMRTQGHRTGSSGKLKTNPVYPCASTGRFEANLVDAIREAVKH